eukprot:5105680-Amphidinium_carterae.1
MYSCTLWAKLFSKKSCSNAKSKPIALRPQNYLTIAIEKTFRGRGRVILHRCQDYITILIVLLGRGLLTAAKCSFHISVVQVPMSLLTKDGSIILHGDVM